MSTLNSQSIYFVDASLTDLDALLAGLPAGAEIVLIQPDRDGLQQMLDALAGRSDIDALHVLTHGGPGKIQLGGTTLDINTLDAASAALRQVADSLANEADILFYGCDVAASDEGLALIGRIADLTGADVAASTDLTGSARLGGDWDLEVATGVIEAPILAVEAMDGVLASGILQNKFVKFGYSDNGTLGFGGSAKPGIQYDKDGGYNFLNTADFLTPGSPWEMFAVKVGSTSFVNNNSSGATAGQMATTLKSTSLTTSGSDTYGSITYESNTTSGLKITQTYTLGQTSKVISMQVTIANTSANTINDVKYARGIDPDVDSNGLPGSTSSTNNVKGGGGIGAGDIVLATGPVSGRVIGLYTDSSFTHNTGVTGWTTDPSTYLSGTNVGNGDQTIGVGFDLGNFVAGQSKTFSFAYVFAANAAALAASVSEVPKSNPAPELTIFSQPVDTTSEDTAVTITYAELIAKGNESDLNADNTAGTVTGFVVKQVNSGSLTIGGTAWVIGSNDFVTTGKDAVWTPAANANGTLTAFSVVARDAEGAVSGSNVGVQVAVAAVNDRPTLVSSTTLRAIAEDVLTANNIGSTVADLFAPRFQDVDSGASLKGIVITANAETEMGNWQYSTDGGATWHNIGTVTPAAGLVLSVTSKIRFEPGPDKSGVPNALTVFALDDTYGTSFTSGATAVTFNTTTASATGPLSTGSVSLGVQVTAVNDAPTFTSAAATATVTETAGADSAVGAGITLTAGTGSTVTAGKLTGTLTATDVDHVPATLAFSIRGGTETAGAWTKQGLFGTLTLNADKTWSYELTQFDTINALAEGAVANEIFDFKVADAAGAAAVQTLTIALTGTNDTPVLAAALADQTLTGTGNWTYQMPAATFTDAEGAGLTYTVMVTHEAGVAVTPYAIGASATGGAEVASSWLTFDEGSRTFTGNPPTGWGDKALTFEVTASDASLSVTDSFELAITGNTNQPPVVANPLQWTSANAPKETTTVTFGDALGGSTVTFDGVSTSVLGAKATGDDVAAALSSGTVNYNQTSTTANAVTLTAKVAGERTDFTAGSINVSGGAYTVAVTQEGADATTESWQVQFLGGTTLGEGTLTVLGQTVAVVAGDTAAEVAGKVVVALSSNATWNVAVDGTNTDMVVFTAKSVGVATDLAAGDFTYVVTADSSAPNPLNTGFDTDGIGEVQPGAAAIAETVTLTFDGAYGGASVTIDGTTVTPGSKVVAADVATAIKGLTYPNHTTSGTGADVVFTAKTAGDQTNITAGSFTVALVGGVTVSPLVVDGSGWSVAIPLNTFSDPDVGDTLTYTAFSFTLDDAGAKTYSAIPAGDSTLAATAGLQFDAATLKVFGDGTTTGGQYIEIRATDGASASNQTAASQFQLVVYSNSQTVSLSPVTGGVPASVAFVDGAGSGSYTVPATAFNFLGETANDLTYSATLDGGGALPSWLSFDTVTGTFSGNPPNGSTDVSVKVTATASTGGVSATTGAFTLAVANPNDPLQLTSALPDQVASVGGGLSVLLDKPFTDPDGSATGGPTQDNITYTATANGQPLSNFGLTLTVDPTGNPGKLLISGNAPAGVAFLNIAVTGTETNGGDTETTSFTLNLGGGTGTFSGALNSNDAGAVTVTSSASISAPKQGDTLTAQTPTDADGVPGTVTYQWQVSSNGTTWTDVAGTRGAATELTLGQTEVGMNVRVQAFYLDGGGLAEAPVSSTLPATLDVNDPGSVTISAGSSVGATLSAVLSDPDGLTKATPTYQWQSASTEGGTYSNIAGATFSSYTIASTDGGQWLKVVTTYTDDQNNVETNVTAAAPRNINLSQIAPVAAVVTGTATEAGGVDNAIAGTNATGSLRSGATDGNPGQAATLVVSGVRAGATEGLGRPANDGGATFTISGEFGDLVVTKATGAYTYTVAQDSESVQALKSGTDKLEEKFNFTLQDADGLSDDAVLTIEITGANDKPTLTGQLSTATVVEDVPTALPLNVLSITDPDSNALTLVLSVTAGTLRVNTLDDSVAVTGNDTATLTLSVSSSPDALRGWLADNQVLFVTPPNATGAVATLSYSINDTTGAVTATGTTAITASAANDAPRVDADGNGATVGSGAIAVFKPRGEAVKLAPALTLSDIDASAQNLASAAVTLVSGAIDNQFGVIYEKLSLSAAGQTALTNAGLTLTVTESAASVVLGLAGNATLAQYQAVLREVLYENSNPSAFTGDRAVSISVTDADGVLGNASSFKTEAVNANIAVGQRIFINNVDSGAVVTTVEAGNQNFIASRPLTLVATDELKFYSATSQPTYAFGADGSLVLATTGDTPLTTATVAAPRLATVTVQVPWTPVVDLNGELSGRDHAITFTEGQTGRAIATADSSITDQDGNLRGVTVTISNPQDGALEKLFYTPAVAANLSYLGITVTGNNSHTLVFSGNKDASQFQPWLRAIQYVNESEDPSVVARKVTVTVTDADNNVGVPATTTVGIVPVNDAPVKGGDYAAALNEGAVYVFTNTDLNSTDVDNDNGTLKYVLTSTPAQGTLFRDTNNNGVVDAGEAIATAGTSDSVANINAIGTGGYFTQAEVNAGTIKYAHDGQNPNGTNATGTDSFGFKVVDGMEDYAFANIATNQAGTVTLTITEVDDLPTGAPVVSGTLQPGQVLTADVSSIADADGLGAFGYQWQVSNDNGVNWTNATGTGSTTDTYTLVTADSGQQVRVQVSYTDAFGHAAHTLTGNATGTVSFTNTGSAGGVTITDDGSPQAGETLTANTSAVTDTDGLGPFSYQWETSTDGTTWTTVTGATSKTYTLPTDAATGAQFRAAVSYTDGRGNAESITSSAATVVAPTALPNQAPSLTGDGAFPATTVLFSNVVVSTVESGQTIQTLTLTVSGLQDGADEKLTVDGVVVDLVATASGALTYPTPAPVGSVGGVSYAITVASGVATVTVAHAGLTEAQTTALVEGLALSGGITEGLRVVTLTSLQDSGGTASSGADTGRIGLSAMVDVGDSLSATPSSNTTPTVSGDLGATVAEGGVVALATADLAGTDAEQPDGLKVKLTSAPTHGTLFRDANGNGKVDSGETLTATSQFALADVANGRIKYLHGGSETTSAAFKFKVGDGLADSTESTFTFTVTPVDDMPTLTATPVGTSGAPAVFTQGGAEVDLFDGPGASPVETAENITGVTLSIGGLRNGADEKLVVDGVEVALTHSTTGTTTANGVGYSVSVTGGTATVTLTKDDTGAVWNTLLDGLAYKNSSTNPTDGARSITLTSVTETGGEKSDVAITSYVGVTAVNGAPSLTLNGFTVAEGASRTLTTTDIAATDPDTALTGLTYTVSTAPTHGTVYIDANGNGKLDSGEALATGGTGTFTHTQLASGKVRYQHDDGETGDSFAITVGDGQATFAAATMTVTRTPVNDAPTLTGLGSDVLSYAANSGAKTLEQGGNAVVTDPDSANFSGGNLRVSISFNRDPAHDVLSIQNAGSGTGQIGVSGNSVTFGGTTIGTLAGGTGTSDLVVTFNNAATPAAVSALVNAIQFANGQAAPALPSRTVSFALNDGQVGGQAAPVAVNVNIATGVTPTISIANGFFIIENTQLVTALSATDPNNRPITFSVSGTADATNNPDGAKFEIVSGNLLRFKAGPDFEAPADAGANNVYNVVVRATNDQGSFVEQALAVTVLDQDPEGVAVGDTEGPVFGFATVNGSTLVMTYTDASPLSATNLPAPGAFTVSGNTVTAVAVNATAKTVTLTLGTAVTNGQTVTVAYTDPTAGNDVLALQDAAGNDASSLGATSVTNVTPSTGGGSSGGGGTGGGSTGGGGTGGGTTTVTNEGVVITTVTQPGVNGTTTTTQTVDPIIPATGGGTGGTSTQYMVSVVAGSTVVQVGLPVGVGVQSIATEGENLSLRQRLVGASNPLVSNDAEFTQIVQNGIDQYVPGVLNPTEVTVRALTLTVPAGTTGVPSAPILITGNANDPSALVIDARQLPKGTVLQVNDVAFAIVLGPAHLSGGAGQNYVVGDDEAQYIVLGADDDILHGGGGNDTVGSLGGNDAVHGDNGDDLVFGGTGNDLLYGGAGSDSLNGGLGYDVAIQSGILSDYQVRLDGNAVVLTNLITGAKDRLLDVERVDFVSGPSLTIAYSEADAAAQHLVTTWLGRNLTAVEGAAVRGWVGATAEQVAADFLSLPMSEAVRDKSITELLAGMDSNSHILRLNVADHYYGNSKDEEGYLPMGLGVVIDGAGGHDILRIAGQRADFHLEKVNAALELTRLSDGAMYSLINTEMIAFDSGDRVVVAETRDDALLARLVNTMLNRDVTLDEWKLGPQAMDDYYVGLETVDSIFAWFHARSDIETLNNSDYVQRLYSNTYGRTATGEELALQLARLSSGNVDRDWLAVEVAASDEAVQLIGTVISLVEG